MTRPTTDRDRMIGEAWQDISTAPRDRTYVLLRFAGPFHDQESPGIAVGMTHDGRKDWYVTCIWASSNAHEEPTHWMPLLKPPGDAS